MNRFWVEWVFGPAGAAIIVHAMIWLAGAFIAWDLAWLSLLGHRIMLVIVVILVWSVPISEEKAARAKGPEQ